LLEESFVFFPADAKPGLGDEVAERQWRRQLRLLAQEMDLDLFQEDIQRGMVDGQVMQQQQQQPVAVGRILGGIGPQQRGLPESIRNRRGS
jgi:hypothetical protein